MGAVWQLTWARFRHRPAHWLLLVVGVALALALPVISDATGRVVAARALSNAVEQLPVGERTVIASYGGTADATEQRHDDGLVREGLGRLTSSPVQHEVLYGELADKVGDTYRLAASDDLAAQIRITSGRLPQSCLPARCEVVLTGATTVPVLDASLGLVVVGTGTRVDPLLLSGTFDPGPAAHVLLGSDPDALQRLAALDQFPRGSGWVAALDTERITSLGVPAYAVLSRDVGDDLSLRIRALVLSVPDDALLREDSRAAASQGRFALLGGATGVLVLGFVMVAAVGLRREHSEVAGLLRRRGASGRALVLFGLLGSGLAVVMGGLVGAGTGWVASWGLAHATPLHPPATALATSSVLDALPTLVLLTVIATVLTTAVLIWPPSQERVAWHVVELLAAASLAAAALAAARGAVGAATVGGDPLSVALPVLALSAAGLLAARIWVPLAAFVSRRLPASAIGARLAAAGGVRRPLRTVVTVGFVTAAVGTVVFAGAYRATLQAGALDTAAFDVPTTARITPGAEGADPVELQATKPLPGMAYPVVRTVAGVRTSATSGEAVTLLGIDPASIEHLARWDRTVGGSDPASVRELIRSPVPVAGMAIPDDSTALTLAVHTWARSAPGDVDLLAWISTPDGREEGVPLVVSGSALVGPLPPGSGRSLTAITLRENPADVTRRLHHVGEGGTVEAVLSGRLVVEAPRGVGWSGWSSRTAPVQAADDTLTIDYQLTGPLIVIRPGLVDRPPVRVVVDPTTATRGGSLRLDLGGGDAVAVQVVGTVPRFPTTGARFLLADRSALAAALDDHQPGSGAAREIWADTAGTDPTPFAAILAAPPWDQTAVQHRESRQLALEADAVAQGAGWLLLLAAGVALLVAVVSLVLLVTGERRDDSGQLLAQEADGVATSTLRRSLWWRAVGAALPALVAGAAAGLLLTRAVSSLVALSASGTAPVPPLEPAVGPGATAVVLVVGLGAALVVCALVSARMLRSPWPGRADQDLR